MIIPKVNKLGSFTCFIGLIAMDRVNTFGDAFGGKGELELIKDNNG